MCAGQGQNQDQKQGQNVRRIALVHTQKIPLIEHFHLMGQRQIKALRELVFKDLLTRKKWTVLYR